MADQKKPSDSNQDDRKKNPQDFPISNEKAEAVKGGRRIVDDEEGPSTPGAPPP